MNRAFPSGDRFLDFAGVERRFEYIVHEGQLGFSVQAREVRQGGYEFEAFSSNSPFDVLGELRQKIRKRLSTRYLQKEHGSTHLYHGEAKGHVSSGGVVIDGEFVSFEKFSSMLQTYEGFFFHLTIQDLSDE